MLIRKGACTGQGVLTREHRPSSEQAFPWQAFPHRISHDELYCDLYRKRPETIGTGCPATDPYRISGAWVAIVVTMVSQVQCHHGISVCVALPGPHHGPEKDLPFSAALAL